MSNDKTDENKGFLEDSIGLESIDGITKLKPKVERNIREKSLKKDQDEKKDTPDKKK